MMTFINKYAVVASEKKPLPSAQTLLFCCLVLLCISPSVHAQSRSKEVTVDMCRSHVMPINLENAAQISIPSGAGVWRSEDGTVVNNVVIPDASKDEQTYYFEVISAAASCDLIVGDRFKVTIQIEDISEPKGEPEQAFCGDSSNLKTLADIEVTGETGLTIGWFDSPSAGKKLSETTTLVSDVTYYATLLKKDCGESAKRLAVLVKIETTPDITVTNPGLQTMAFDLEKLIIESNESDGEITFHSAQPSDAFDMSNQITNLIIESSQTIYVMKANDAGCFDVEEVEISIEGEFFIPQGFSPNGDGYNERFVITGLKKFPDAKLEVYNRWNAIVYSKENYGNEDKWGADEAWWDGKSNGKMGIGNGILPADNYIYILTYDGKIQKGIVFINW